MRRQLAGMRLVAALTATAGTAAPAPAAAPVTQAGGACARNSTDRARITIRPGTMKHSPPTIAPATPASRHAQKIASWVDAGPGSKFVAAMPSSNSSAVSQDRRCTQSWRSRAMWAGGPPNPMQPIRPHSRAITRRGTRTGSLSADTWPGSFRRRHTAGNFQRRTKRAGIA